MAFKGKLFCATYNENVCFYINKVTATSMPHTSRPCLKAKKKLRKDFCILAKKCRSLFQDALLNI